MLDFHQKRKIRSVAYNRITLVVLGILVLIVLHSTWSVYQKERESGQMKDIAKNNLVELQSRDSDLKAKINNIDTTAGVEEKIRSKFTVAKYGENMVVVVPDNNSNASTTTSSIGFWQKIWGFFFK